MLNKLEKLEEFLNKYIERVFTLLKALYFKIIPKKLFVIWSSFCFSVKTVFNKANSLIQTQVKKIRIGSKSKKQLLDVKINSIKNYPYKTRLFSLVEFFKTFLLKTPLKKHAHRIAEAIKGKINHVDTVTDRVGKGQLAMGFIAFSLITIGFVSVVNSTNQIVQAEFPERAPASIQEYRHKPKYKKFSERTMKVLNIKIPVYRNKVSEIRSVTVDFTVRTSTRFASKYLVHYENQLKDYFFTNVEPVVSSFTIEEEGKDVFKEKIAIDLSNFLKENRVEGEIEDVQITFIVAN